MPPSASEAVDESNSPLADVAAALGAAIGAEYTVPLVRVGGHFAVYVRCHDSSYACR